MASATRLSEFLRDLQQLDKTAHGDALLDPFIRHTAFADGALYLRDARDSSMKLAAKTQQCVAPEILDGELPTDLVSIQDYTLVPLRTSREHFGVVRLNGTPADDDLEVVKAAAAFASQMLTNQRLAQEMREGDFQLKYRLWELESLYDIGLSIASTLNTDELADEVLFRMISLTNSRHAALYLRDGDAFAAYRSFGEVTISEESLQKLAMDPQPTTLDGGSIVAVPIKGNNSIIGVLAVAERETRDGGVGAFEANDLRLLSQFANQVGIALENARLHKEALRKQAMERELELAATIQRDILPKAIPQVEGIEVAALSRPARQVGGDYHAFFEHDTGVTMVVADVSGKSMPAALLVSALHAATQLLFGEGREIGDIATELNRHLHSWSAENKFVTMIIASIDREAETIEFVNAGHNPCYVLTEGKLELLRSHGLPIGILGQSKYMSQTRPFPRGSAVVLYSDGITEAENEAGEEYENPRLEEVLTANMNASPAELRDRIAAAVDAFVGAAAQKDDQTLVIARSR
jgi:sigma-B regulation protein RsbU (phosphoserine phosphatase)